MWCLVSGAAVLNGTKCCEHYIEPKEDTSKPVFSQSNSLYFHLIVSERPITGGEDYE